MNPGHAVLRLERFALKFDMLATSDKLKISGLLVRFRKQVTAG